MLDNESKNFTPTRYILEQHSVHDKNEAEIKNFPRECDTETSIAKSIVSCENSQDENNN